jgi:hypothetical protein
MNRKVERSSIPVFREGSTRRVEKTRSRFLMPKVEFFLMLDRNPGFFFDFVALMAYRKAEVQS